MSSNNEFVIPFEGLKLGKHEFEFKITDAFFEELDYSIIHGANMDIKFVLEKKETMLIAFISMNGFILKPCDRCMEMLEVPTNINHQMYYKFGNEESGDENLIVLPPSAFTIDIAPILYELLTVSLPKRTVHKKGECNEDMMHLIEKYQSSSRFENDKSNDDESNDPRWNKLKKLN